MPTITVTVIEHAATERKPWRVVAHDGTHRFTMPVRVGVPMAMSDAVAIRALVQARAYVNGERVVLEAIDREYVGLTPGGHRRYRVAY